MLLAYDTEWLTEWFKFSAQVCGVRTVVHYIHQMLTSLSTWHGSIPTLGYQLATHLQHWPRLGINVLCVRHTLNEGCVFQERF